VLSQVALAVTLLSGAALMARSFARLRDVQPGIDPVGVQSMEVILPFAHYKDAARINAFWRELTKRVEAVPGVVRAGASADLPFGDSGGCSGILTDVVDGSGERGNCMPMTWVTPGYLEAIGVKVRGQLPTWADIDAGRGPAVVTAAFAKRFWHDSPVIGRGVKAYNDKNPYSPIVGVAADVHANGLQNPPIEEAFFPIVGPPGTFAWTMRAMHFVVRAPTLSQSAVVAAVRRAIDDLDRQVPIADVESMETLVAKSTAQTSFTMLLLLIASGIALALSAVGIYGVISYIVGQRRGEIGIRIALGAQRGQVARLVVRQSLALAVVGAVVGVVVSLASTRLLRSLLFEVSPTDPLVLVGAAVALIAVAVVATFGPVRRAAGIDPVEAMRG
jgi:predicted permease